MSVKINGVEVHGVLGYLIAVPVVVITFLWLALTFLGVVLLMLSPFILIALMAWWLL